MNKAISSFILVVLALMSSPAKAQNQFTATKEMSELMFAALDHGIGSIQEGGPLVPFSMIETHSKRKLSRFVAEPYEAAVVKVKASIGELSPAPDMYAIAYDGFITVSGKKYDAIIVHGAQRGKGQAFVLAQRYMPASAGNPLKPVGNPAFVGREDALFH